MDMVTKTSLTEQWEHLDDAEPTVVQGHGQSEPTERCLMTVGEHKLAARLQHAGTLSEALAEREAECAGRVLIPATGSQRLV